MTKSHVVTLLSIVVLPLLSMPAVEASCGSAVCPLNTQWEIQGDWTASGWRADVRYEYIKQDDLRFETTSVGLGEIPSHHDELETINQNMLVNLDYSFDSEWGISVVLPATSREHTHLHNHQGSIFQDTWDFDSLGDVQVLGRFMLPDSGWSTTFGLKLPSGDTDIANQDGSVAERTLQPGTGTTDAILGVGYSRRDILSPISWFAQMRYQRAFNEHDDYRSGYGINVDAGIRYAVSHNFGLIFQGNFQYTGRDTGSEAETDLTGGRFLFLSPGASYAITESTQVYGFYQVAAYRRVNGVQLTADAAATVGVSSRF